MNTINTAITEFKTLVVSSLLKSATNTTIKNKYFDNTFSSTTFKEMLFSKLVENSFEKIELGFEKALNKELSK